MKHQHPIPWHNRDDEILETTKLRGGLLIACRYSQLQIRAPTRLDAWSPGKSRS